MQESEVAQSCPTLRDPMDCSLPGSSVHGIFQARVLEWVTQLSLATRGEDWASQGQPKGKAVGLEGGVVSYTQLGEGNGNPLQCSCLENLRDGRAWWAAVGEGNGNPLQSSCLENPVDRGACDSWGCKEWDMTERLI